MLLLLIPVAPASAAAGDAQALLAKHRAFVGWQFGDGSFTSMRLERIYTNDAGKVTQRATERRLGLAYRRDYQTVKDYREGNSTGFTGNLFWTTSDNGFTVPTIGDSAKVYLAVDVLFMEGTTELPATLQGSTTVDGKSAEIVRISMNGAAPFDVYEDPETGAYLKAVIDPDGQQEETVVIHSYADLAPGKKIIGAWSLGDDKGVYSYTKLTVNAPVAPSDLHPPLPSATWTFANSQPIPIKVTDSRLYVDVKVNGVPGRFILDTGAGGIAMFDEFANRANVKTVDKGQSFGIGGATKNLVRKADTVEIGGNTLSNVIVSSLNEQFKDTQNFEKPDGLIGFDLFGGAIVDLSLSLGTMRILNPAGGAAPAPAGAFVVVPDLQELVPRVPVKLDNKFPIMAMLDTGGESLVLFSNQVEDHGIHLIVNPDRTFVGGNAVIRGVGGEEFVRCGPLASVEIGPVAYTATEGCESSNWGLHEGLIGFDFLKHFDYVFDYPHGVMYMIPHKD